jgi:acetyl-CoA C-acetyltransferase
MPHGVFVYDALRTPRGKGRGGALHGVKPVTPETIADVQLNRFCASGLEAVNTAAQKIASGWESLVLAGGVESMSRVPMSSDGGAEQTMVAADA